jgi:hypothetical protein
MSSCKRMAGAAIVAAAVLVPAAASAEVYTVRVTPNNSNCFAVTYRQQVEQINTRGKLVRPPSPTFSYTPPARVPGGPTGLVIQGLDPALYLETRRVVEPEHYSMAPTPCPAR